MKTKTLLSGKALVAVAQKLVGLNRAGSAAPILIRAIEADESQETVRAAVDVAIGSGNMALADRLLSGIDLDTLDSKEDRDWLRIQVENIYDKLSQAQRKLIGPDIESRVFTIRGNAREEIMRCKVPLTGAALTLSASTVYRSKAEGASKKAVILFDFLDESGNVVTDIPGIQISTKFNQHFLYLNESARSVGDPGQELVTLKLPDEIRSVMIYATGWGLTGGESIEVRLHGRFYDEMLENRRHLMALKLQPLPEPVIFDPETSGLAREMPETDAATAAGRQSDGVVTVKLQPAEWASQIEGSAPDFLLVDVASLAGDTDWGVSSDDRGAANAVSALLTCCRARGIPTVLLDRGWIAAEADLGSLADEFDLCATVDSEAIPGSLDFGIQACRFSDKPHQEIKAGVSSYSAEMRSDDGENRRKFRHGDTGASPSLYVISDCIQGISQLIADGSSAESPRLTLAVVARSSAEVQRAKDLFELRSTRNMHLLVELEIFEDFSMFLNQSSDDISYMMKFARNFGSEDRQAGGSGNMIRWNSKCPLPDDVPVNFADGDEDDS